ncbi:MAG TPA: hypothetical protein VLD84_07790 [Nitrososphaeraceae archaeon]|nr:hypothetical protein [Nitrososphaeraceae archaeon]
MKTKITSVSIIIAATTMIFASSINSANLALAISKTDAIDYKSNYYHTSLLNCLSDDSSYDTDDSTQWFEPMGCYSDNDLSGSDFEGPYEEGWE